MTILSPPSPFNLALKCGRKNCHNSISKAYYRFWSKDGKIHNEYCLICGREMLQMSKNSPPDCKRAWELVNRPNNVSLRTFSHSGHSTVGLYYYCHGCGDNHHIPIKQSAPGPKGVTTLWQFNEMLSKPTLTPSVLTDENWGDGDKVKCHHFIKDGIIEYCHDCPHDLKGKRVPIDFYWDPSNTPAEPTQLDTAQDIHFCVQCWENVEPVNLRCPECYSWIGHTQKIILPK